MKRPDKCPSCGRAPHDFQPLPVHQLFTYGCGSRIYGPTNTFEQSERCLIAEQKATIAALRQELAESRAKEGTR